VKNIRKMLKSAIKPFFRRTIWTLDVLIPKNESLYVFGFKRGKYAGNTKHLFEYIIENHPEIKAVGLTLDKEICEHVYSKYEKRLCLNIYSLAGLWTFLRSKVALFTHGKGDFVQLLSTRTTKLTVNLWHGEGIKANAYALTTLNIPFEKKLKERWDLFTTSSRFFSLVMINSFRHHIKKTIVTGVARNDMLMLNMQKPVQEERIKIKELLGLNYVPQHIFLYAPTYRKNKPVRFFPFENFDIERFDKIMTKNQAVIMMRGHLNDMLHENAEETSFELLQTKEWFKILSSLDLQDIQEILHTVTLLITDYSSISTDYLLVDGHLMFFPYDLEKYEKAEGLMYSYNPMSPGPKIKTGEEFLSYLESYFKGEDKYKGHRKIIRDLSFEITEPIIREKIITKIKEELN
jgi:CDP-glycerol glycerophosphotransferase